MENPLTAGFVKKQHKTKTWAWSGKTTEGQASPPDCHKIAEIISDEDIVQTTYHSCSTHLWNMVSKFSLESIFVFNFNVDGVV
jgi:hypothetical protein